MSKNERTSNDGSIGISEDRARAVDEAGRRAGAALRSPAPAHGAAAIQRQARRRSVVRVAAATAGVGVLLVAGGVAFKAGDRSSELRPVDTLTNTLPDTNSTAAPSTIVTTPTVAAGPLEVAEAGTSFDGSSAHYSADGSMLAIMNSERGSVLIHDSATLTVLRELPCPTSLERLPASFGTADSRDFVWDVEAASRWDAEAFSVFKSAFSTANLCGVIVSTDGSRALSAADVQGDAPREGRQLLWDTSDGSLVAMVPGLWAGFSDDGSRLVTADSISLSLWDTSTGAVVTTITDFPVADPAVGVSYRTGTVFSPDRNRMLRWGVPTNDGTGGVVARIYDTQTLTSAATLSARSPGEVLGIEDAVFDDTSGRVATWDAAAVTTWDALTGAELQHVATPPVGTVGFSPGGDMFALPQDGHITIFDSLSGVQLTDIELEAGIRAGSVVFSADGSSLAADVNVEATETYGVRVWLYKPAN